MPTISVYIKKEDLPVWKRLKGKSEFMHNCLAVVDAYKALKPSERQQIKDYIRYEPMDD